ncbi:hypothetical protein HF313_26090 [Massilia atriviolacea]|nr:hypothetical protein [Massilia atriviolacea]
MFFRFGIATILVNLIVGCESNIQRVTSKAEQERNNREVAKKIFEQRCLSSGEKIKRKVDNVDGIFLMKLRPEKLNFSNQYLLDDPYGSDFTGDAYIRSFLRGFYEHNYRKSDHSVSNAISHIGYRYVDAIDETDKKRYRYVGIVEQPGLTDATFLKGYRRFVLRRTLADGPVLRYGVTYEDISNKVDRDHWIAGSSLKVIDLKTNEVIAERIGYMYDPGQGGAAGGRSPWMIAASYSCPSFGKHHGSASQDLQTETFVSKVLKSSI